MVGVSYHELTAQTAKDEQYKAGQRKQFLVICVIGFAIAANSFINAGLFETVMIDNDGIYPGGQFVYKLFEDRDFAATGGLWRRISDDLQTKNNDTEVEQKFDDILYSIYIDNIDRGIGRFFTGILIDQSQKELKKMLLSQNEKQVDEKKKDDDYDAEAKFGRIKYEEGDLPSVRAAVATFPYTDGFISALLHNYKVFPTLYKYAKENQQLFHKDKKQNDNKANKIVISTSCNRELQLCKHYIPLAQTDKFLLGNLDTEEYRQMKKEMNGGIDENNLDLMKMLKGVKKLLGF